MESQRKLASDRTLSSDRPSVDQVFPVGTVNWISWIARAASYFCFSLVAATFLYHISRGSAAYLGFLEDDYFYYATIADNLVRFGRFTYDGTTLTNGFHPLWQLVLTLLRLVCGRFGPAYYVGLTIVSTA